MAVFKSQSRPATTADSGLFIGAMSAEDITLFGPEGVATLGEAIQYSCYTYTIPGFVLGGLQPNGLVWQVATPRVATRRRLYMEETRSQLAIMLDVCPLLWAYVDPAYGLRWLRWLGFTVGSPWPALGRLLVRVECRSLR